MSDVLEQLGSLALGSRLRRVSDPLMYGTGKLYKSLSIDFEPRWFPVYTTLYRRWRETMRMETRSMEEGLKSGIQVDSTNQVPLSKPSMLQVSMSISELTEATGLTQPAVSQIMTQMLKKDWVVVHTDSNDARRRLFQLTPSARESYTMLEPVWKAVRQAANALLSELDAPLLPLLAQLEHQLEHHSFYERIQEQLEDKSNNESDNRFENTENNPANKEPQEAPMIDILEYQPSYQSYFEQFNREWLERYFVVEPYDAKVLGDPETYIIQPGGSIYFAKLNEAIVGTVALIPREDGVVELSKMGVTSDCQARGIGRTLAQYVIGKAKTEGYHTVMLDSNTKLVPAIKLYRKLGFMEIPTDPNSPYERANIRMVIPFCDESPWFGDYVSKGHQPSDRGSSQPASVL